MKPLIIIPARGGSKGVPNKNIRLLGNKPLINYTIKAALEIFDPKYICVSTDDAKIRAVAEECGLTVPFLRPAELARDDSNSRDVILHALDFYESKGYYPDTVIFLQPTSPFRNGEHIIEALSLFNQGLDMVVSVKETKSNPYFMLYEDDDLGYLEQSKKGHFIRRQDCPAVWELNGAIYIINKSSIRASTIPSFSRTRKYVMDEYSSHDIDTWLDWKLAELILLSNDS